MSERLIAVITIIPESTPGVTAAAECPADHAGSAIVIGDKKGPTPFDLSQTELFRLPWQMRWEVKASC